MNEIEQSKPFQRSARTGLLIALFTRRFHDAGHVLVTYKEIGSAISVDPEDRVQILKHMSTVKHRLLVDENLILEAVPNEGYKILDAPESVNNVSADSQAIHRRAHRAVRKVRTVNTEKLSFQDRRRLHSNGALLGLMSSLTRPSKIAKLEDHLGDEPKKLKITDALNLLRGSKATVKTATS